MHPLIGKYIGQIAVKRSVIVCGGAILLVGAFFMAINRAPAGDVTLTRLLLIEIRIREFYAQHREIPNSLYDLPERPGYNNSLQDAWGSAFQYKTDGLTLTLSSAGRDGVFGTDNDIVHQLELPRLTASMSDDEVYFRVFAGNAGLVPGAETSK